MFDVLRKSSHRQQAETFVLLQPQPGLGDIFHTLSLDTATTLPNIQSAYVGMVEQTGSLFAMSPSRFPLVAFGDASRPSIDPNPNPSAGSGDVDEITRTRKRDQELARQASRCMDPAVLDLKCLVGLRPLAGRDDEDTQSQLKLWLDGPSSQSRLPIQSGPAIETHTTTSASQRLPLTIDSGPLTRGDTRLPVNSWQAAVTVVALAAVSLWFGLKRMRTSPLPIEAPIPESSVEANPSPPRTPIEYSAELIAPGTPLTPTLDLGSTDRGDDTDRDNEADGETTPGPKKKRPRGRRGKGKKGGASAEDTPGSPNIVPPTPLPAPPEPSLIIQAPEVKSPTTSLIVSDSILGSYRICICW